MTELTLIVIAAWAAGLTAVLGGIFAWAVAGTDTEVKAEFTHGIIALGGGILMAAVAFALLPRGMAVLNPISLGVTFCLGGLLFCFLDAYMSRRGGSKAQFVAMLVDFLPEALALGAVFSHDRRLGMLLAAFIGAQNLPEGFNAFREFIATGVKTRHALIGLLAAGLLGPIAASAGYLFFHNHETWTAMIMTFASGGIVYLVFQDIAPQARMRKHWVPTLGAVLGFAIGMIGKQLIG